MMDRVCDKFSDNAALKNPLLDIIRDQVSNAGEVTENELTYLKAKILEQLQNSIVLDDAIMSLMSESKYPENIPEAEEIGTGDLEEVIDQGYLIQLEPASRLLYSDQDDQVLFWANGEGICISEQFTPSLQKIADGQAIALNIELADDEILEDIVGLLNESILMLVPTEE